MPFNILQGQVSSSLLTFQTEELKLTFAAWATATLEPRRMLYLPVR
jgi:hypothetical protein